MADGFYSSNSGGYNSGGYYQNQQTQQPYSNAGFYNSAGTNAAAGGYASSSQPGFFQPSSNTSSGTTPTSTNNKQEQQSQQQNPMAASIFNPTTIGAFSAAASGNKEAMFGYAEQAGKDFLKGGTSRLIPGLELFMKTLRPYFAVNNTFVRKKMQRVVFSFLSKEWDRTVSRTFS